MRPMTLPWGPLLGTREGAELSKRVLTQAPLPLVSLILILGVKSLLLTPALGMVKARRRKKMERKRRI